MFDFFDRKVCLTTKSRRWAEATLEFERVNLTDVIKFQSIPDIGPHQSFSRSMRRILIDSFGAGVERLLILEDDCVFKDDVGFGHLPAAIAELPEDWDVVYFGANVVDETPERFSDHLYRIRNAWTTHCLGYSRKVIPFILENQVGYSEQMFDNWLGSQLGNLNAFVVNPMVAWQRPHYSLIWGKEVDYNEVFSLSQQKLI